jgi:hypothetical protein
MGEAEIVPNGLNDDMRPDISLYVVCNNNPEMGRGFFDERYHRGANNMRIMQGERERPFSHCK